MFVCLREDTTPAAALSVTSWFLIVSFPASWSIGLLHWRVKWRWDGDHHPCVFQVLNSGTNFGSFSRDAVLFLIHSFPWQRQLERLPFNLSKYNSPHCTGQGTNVRILPTSKYIYPNYMFWDWGNNYRMSLRTTGPTVSQASAKTPLITWPL